MATGKDAVLFNPAEPRNLHKYGIDGKYEGKMVTYIVSGEILSETDGRIFNNIPGEKSYVGIDEHLPATIAKLCVDSLISTISGNFVGKTGFGDLAAAIVEFIESFNNHSLLSFLKH